MRTRSVLLASVALALLGGASAASGDPPRRPPPSVHYEVSVDASLEHLRARVCFDGAAPASLGPGVDAAARALVEATDDAGRALPVRRDRIDLSSLGDGACMRYRVDLEIARRASRFAGRVDGELVSSQGAWLWRDRRRVPEGGATIRFTLPDGLFASTPWPVAPDGTQTLGPSAFQRPGFVAFGHRAPRVIERQHVRARLVRLGEGWQLDEDALAHWLEEAIDGIATVQGRFPVDDLLVILVPAPGSGMGFGMVRRGGGFSAIYMVGRESTPESLRESWVTWHELSHLQLPALPQRDAWMYEGLATYYQEVLPARLGIQTPTAAWSELVDGFDRGASSRGGGALTEASTTMFATGGFGRVYWAGTAFALEADVALRQRGSSLDDALRRAAPRWRGDLEVWDSARVCAAWDAPLDASVLRPLRDRYAGQVGFPATAPLLSRLGVRRDADGVALASAELSAVRESIMRR
ncbi:MAG: hypothetical protein H6719_15165 [Sandaracinaceae bacterium]|nr:hypothetical protein [Sandaracinaceae bacterium]